LTKITAEKILSLVDITIVYPYYSLGLLKRKQATGEAFQPSNDPTLQKFKFINFFYFCGSVFAFLDPDPRTQWNPDPIRIRIRIHNAVLRHLALKVLTFKGEAAGEGAATQPALPLFLTSL
jgi:hypothetical protein